MKNQLAYWFILTVVLHFPMHAQGDYCALRVTVKHTNGKMALAPVTIIGENASPVASARSLFGVAEFCDLGFEKFTVLIGLNKCGQVVIKNIETTFPKTVELNAIFDGCAVVDIPLSTCVIMFRIQSDGRPVAKARVAVNSAGSSERNLIADRYGRVFTAMTYGSEGKVTFSHPGYQEKILNVACFPNNRRYEQLVILNRK